jgi:hypothetical protein
MMRDWSLSVREHEIGWSVYVADPFLHHWDKSRRKAAFVRDVRVGEEGNVGDGIIADEETVLR